MREGAELLQADEGNVRDPAAASGGAELVVDGPAAQHDPPHLVRGHQVRLARLRVPGPMPGVVRGLQQVMSVQMLRCAAQLFDHLCGMIRMSACAWPVL